MSARGRMPPASGRRAPRCRSPAPGRSHRRGNAGLLGQQERPAQGAFRPSGACFHGRGAAWVAAEETSGASGNRRNGLYDPVSFRPAFRAERRSRACGGRNPSCRRSEGTPCAGSRYAGTTTCPAAGGSPAFVSFARPHPERMGEPLLTRHGKRRLPKRGNVASAFQGSKIY